MTTANCSPGGADDNYGVGVLVHHWSPSIPELASQRRMRCNHDTIRLEIQPGRNAGLFLLQQSRRAGNRFRTVMAPESTNSL
jgi:hypothetical protein